MKDFAKVFGTKTDEGEWYTEPQTGAKFKIVQLTSPVVKEYCLKNNIDINARITDEEAIKVLANAVIKDWEVVYEGKKVPFSVEKVTEFLTMYSPLVMWVNAVASKVLDTVTGDIKNLKKSEK
jgi:hypothetical protein